MTDTAAGPAPASTDALLRDGSAIHLRAMAPDDSDRLRRFIGRLSPESLRLRFHIAHPHVSDAQVARFVDVDGHDRVAVVATQDGEIVGVGRYDRLTADSAEAAFTVADSLQGKGLGSLLLEHLAAAARRNGITSLVAMTLTENARMLDVFHESGFATSVERDGPVYTITIDLADTAPYESAVARREWIASSASVRRLLEPRAVAVIGAGRSTRSIGHRILLNIKRGGYAGPLYPVNPHADVIDGMRCYRSPADLPGDCDLGIIAVPASAVRDAVDQCGRAGMRGVVIISSGFAEVGADGAEAERAVVEAAHSHGMRIIGPNGMGVINAAIGLDATFAASPVRAGHVGFASQSGAMGIALLERAAAEGLGLTTFVSLGNKADVSGNDMLRYWYDDASTKVALLYLESLGNPRAFARVARKVSQRKPIVALKSGRSPAGARAASSHTAAMATSETALTALFEHTGVLRVRTLEELLDTAALISTQPLPSGSRVAVITNAGGAGILAADACADAGLGVDPLPGPLQLELVDAVSPASAVNPVDLGAGALATDFARALDLCLRSPEVDACVVIAAPVPHAPSAEVLAAIAARVERAVKPVLPVLLGVELPLEQRAGMAVYTFPENAVAALGRAAAYVRWRARPDDAPFVTEDADAAPVTALLRRRLQGSGPGWLDPVEVAALLAAAGITHTSERAVETQAAAVRAARDIGFPVALKGSGARLLHKSDSGAVVLGIDSAAALERAWQGMRTRLGSAMEGGVVQAMARGEAELIIGGVNDPAFGPLIMVGTGGITAEVSGDRAFATAPLSRPAAEELLDGTRAGRLLRGYRSLPPLARDAVLTMLLRTAALLAVQPEIAEIDLNPVIVGETCAVAVDARIRVDAAVRELLPVRHLGPLPR